MVRGSYHHDSVVALDAVHSIQEEGAHLVRNNGVEIFEYEVAWGGATSQTEDLVDAVFRAIKAFQCLDIQLR